MRPKRGQKTKGHATFNGATRWKAVKGPAGCGCRKSKRGSPHVCVGMCKIGMSAERARERHEARAALKKIVNGG